MHRTTRKFDSSDLTAHCFEIHYQTHEEGQAMNRANRPDLPFALVIRIRIRAGEG
jgi:hypothetical protein